jgi:hypothetical protein
VQVGSAGIDAPQTQPVGLPYADWYCAHPAETLSNAAVAVPEVEVLLALQNLK